ncbi:amine oxidase [Trichoderma barbatum]
MASRSFKFGVFAVLLREIQSVVAAPAGGGSDSICRKTSVAVLGAGMAGITAAQALHNASVSDFVIIEYQDRIGGRAWHRDFGSKPDGSPYVIEYGCNWIQGLGNPGGPENPVYSLAKKYHLANTYSDYGSILTYDETGYTDFSELVDEYGIAYDKAAAKAGRFLVQNLQDQTMRAGLSIAGWNPKHGDMKRQAAEWWNWDWEASFPPEVSSFIFGVAGSNLTFNQFSDANNFVIDPRGYSAIIDGEASTFLSKKDPRLLLNTRITNITYSNHGVTVYNHDGSCVSADYAISTFSLGVLQSNVIGFSPELPQWKKEAIQNFAMGTYTKIFLQFNETFWPEDTQYFLYASPTTRGYYPVWQSLSTEGFMPGSNIIFATVIGDESYRIEQQTDEETKAEAMEVLRQMFPNVTIPEPIAFTYPRWNSEQWSLGSYSNWPAGTSLLAHQNLRANTGRLWFAGEATSAEYFGFLHGAWFEGREAGAQVAALLQSRRCVQYENDKLCGERKHYDTLKGVSPLSQYSLLNGWAVSSLYDSGDD